MNDDLYGYRHIPLMWTNVPSNPASRPLRFPDMRVNPRGVGSMRFRVLGSMRVWDGDRWVCVGRAEQRLLLAVLLLEAGPVCTERLIREIWPERRPLGAYGVLHGHVFRLQRILGDGRGGPLVRRDGGYELIVADGDVDAQVFTDLAAAGRREMAVGRVGLAASRLAQALALWRGPALADVPATPTISSEAVRLERARLAARRARADVWLRLGRPA
jgi:DNA-binding SARP family transcriptional activator